MGGAVRDLTGQRFGKLIVIHRASRAAGEQQAHWICKCDCGNTTRTRGNLLTGGNVASCGCLRADVNRARTDISGKQYGDWTAVERVPTPFGENTKGRWWLCVCVCGEKKVMPATGLTRKDRPLSCRHLSTVGS